ncbi:unnamed protein product [Amoebophrya sp. A120]|nr:unnamed protein product [Amoebophrya sp. A120]|eukprot:GSA120T00009859001.1
MVMAVLADQSTSMSKKMADPTTTTSQDQQSKRAAAARPAGTTSAGLAGSRNNLQGPGGGPAGSSAAQPVRLRSPRRTTQTSASNAPNSTSGNSKQAVTSTSSQNQPMQQTTHLPQDERRKKVIENLTTKGLLKPIAVEVERGLCDKAVFTEKNKPVVPSAPNSSKMLTKQEYSEYQIEYRRLVQFFRSNKTLVEKTNQSCFNKTTNKINVQSCYNLCFLSQAELESEEMTAKRTNLEEKVLQEAMAIDPRDDPRWTKVAKNSYYHCPKCNNSEEILMLATVGTHRKEDQSDEPVITLRCLKCDHLWKETDGETFAG